MVDLSMNFYEIFISNTSSQKLGKLNFETLPTTKIVSEYLIAKRPPDGSTFRTS